MISKLEVTRSPLKITKTGHEGAKSEPEDIGSATEGTRIGGEVVVTAAESMNSTLEASITKLAGS